MRRNAKGAAAVEFALVLPILVALLIGIMEFGYWFYLSSSAAGAAREGARDLAINSSKSGAAANAETLALQQFYKTTPVSSGATATASISSATCSVEITYSHASLTGALSVLGIDVLPAVRGEGVMRCGG